jgi:protein decreased size exclusion limit 1
MIKLWDTSRVDTSPKQLASNTGRPNNNKVEEMCSFTTGSYNFCKCATVKWSNLGKTSLGVDGANSVAASDPSDVDQESFNNNNNNDNNSGRNRESVINSLENLIASPCADSSTVGIWDIRSLKDDRPCMSFFNEDANHVKDKTGMLMCLKFVVVPSNSNSTTAFPSIIAGFESGGIGVFDIRSNKDRFYLKVHNEPLLSLDVNDACTQIITSAADAKLHVVSMDLSQPTPLQLNCSNNSSGGGGGGEIVLDKPGVEMVTLRSRQDIFATAGWDWRVRIFEWNQPHQPLAVLKHHTAGVTSVSWSDNSELLASASKDGNIAVWSIFSPPPLPVTPSPL